MIDLHTHTTASDGQYSPTALINKAYTENIRILAITDHDSISGVSQALLHSKELNITCIPGIEISVKDSKEMHILGYYIDIFSESVKRMSQRFIDLRKERAEKIIEFLQAKNINITLDDVTEYAQTELIARPHFAQALHKKSYVNDLREAFDKYLATPEFDKIERPKPSPEEGIQMIHDSGGVAVLAHPMSLKLAGKELELIIKRLVNAGLDGIETYYGCHSPAQKEEYHTIALKYNLIETIGSDFHGENVKHNIFLGMGAEGIDLPHANQIVEALRNKKAVK